MQQCTILLLNERLVRWQILGEHERKREKWIIKHEFIDETRIYAKIAFSLSSYSFPFFFSPRQQRHCGSDELHMCYESPLFPIYSLHATKDTLDRKLPANRWEEKRSVLFFFWWWWSSPSSYSNSRKNLLSVYKKCFSFSLSRILSIHNRNKDMQIDFYIW